MKTHEVVNQVPRLLNYNLYSTDKALEEAVQREAEQSCLEDLVKFGSELGSDDLVQHGIQANICTPRLRSHDHSGHRIDHVEYHPSYHRLMEVSVKNGLHCSPWQTANLGEHVLRAAKLYMDTQNEAGHCCPVSMTYSIVPVLRKEPSLAALFEDKLLSRNYDHRQIPFFEKSGITAGMAMTEKQGGSDVRTNSSSASPMVARGCGQPYLLKGHKWFCSSPASDVFLMLAQTKDGLSCFLVPRFTLEGVHNNIFIQRLKDKLGNRSNASGEIEFAGTVGYLIGEEGRGIPTIIDMVNHTRLDCVITSAGMIRQALVQACYYANSREAFGKVLIDQPLMRSVLADLAIESEAATLLAMRLARSYDRQHKDESEMQFKRLASAIAKFYICKRAPTLIGEAMECLGGNGYVEENILARLYRDSPVNSIWEGSGNVICLDVLRAIQKEPQSLAVLFDEIGSAEGVDPGFDSFFRHLRDNFRAISMTECRARWLTEQLCLALEASLLLRFSPEFVFSAFVSSRLGQESGGVLGSLPSSVPFEKILARAWSH